VSEQSVRDQAAAIARGGTGIKAQLRRMIDRMQSRHMLAKRVFTDAGGELTRPATEWMRRLARDNFVESSTFIGGDRDKMLINEGRRALALEILSSVSIDAERLGALTKMERETDA
jgi:hypothetical protein